MPRLFGTDGVRGLAGRDVTAELAVKLADAATRVLARGQGFSGRKPRAIMGNDSRVSGGYLGAAVAAGLAGAGVDVVDVGTLPTPGLAYLTATQGFDLGVMLSASHNPMSDNGIKFFGRGGLKLPDAVEDEIASVLGESWERPTGAAAGSITADHWAARTYAEHLVKSAPTPLHGLTVVLDCANGASYEVAPEVFRRLGARVIATAAAPDGLNINADVGSTHPEALAKAVVEAGADAGFAFDGDADRCLGVDAAGEIVSGDQIMAILALAFAERGALARDQIVATVMSNLGLHQAMARAGIGIVTTDVGDRYVLEEMLRGGYCLGGEQSGHVIMTEFGTTGDGVLTAVQVAARMAASGEPLAKLAGVMANQPQVLVNVPDVDKARVGQDPVLAEAVAAAEARLGQRGRVLLRSSGTEPLVRVMVEAPTQDEADAEADRLALVVRQRLGLPGSV
jgi:phosphoglucosamine mutase